MCTVPPPSSETKSWWDPLDVAVVQQKVAEEKSRRDPKVSNPFDTGYLVKQQDKASAPPGAPASTLSSAATIKRKPPPPDPTSKPVASTTGKPPVNHASKPGNVQLSPEQTQKLPKTSDTPKDDRKKSSTSSLMDQQDEEMSRPKLKAREATNEWQIISPSPMKR
jgi:hypothetical protein